MAERSFAREVEDLKLGDGDEFRGEGILAIDVGWSIYATCCHEQDGWRMVLLRRTTGA